MSRVTDPAEQDFGDYYRVLAENAEDHIFVISRDDTIEFVNAAAARQHRRVPSDLMGRKRTEIFPPDVAERQGQNLRRVFETGRPVYVEARTMYGEREVWLSTWLAPVTDPDGHVKAVLGVSRDLTERKRAEDETRTAQKLEALGRLAGGIAHDFNNNLTAILGYVDLLIDRVDPRESIARDLTEVRRAAERSAGLVRRLLAFGRRQVLQTKPVDLHAVITTVAPMLERLLGEHVKVDVLGTPGVRAVNGDASELEQVIINLALNARDAMPGGGTLTIETANAEPSPDQRAAMGPGPYVLMRISDTGDGMSAQVRDQIFDPFFTTKPAGKGTGLGLSAVYGIIKQLNGFVWVDSEPGAGSTFYVYLPVATEEAGGTETIAARHPSAPSQAHTVLVVEDEETVRRFIKRALQSSGFSVLEAQSPDDALAIAARGEPITLLLTDVVMPRMSGPELARRLRAARPDLPVLYMSGYPSSVVMSESEASAAIPLLAKPFTTTQLVARIYHTLAAQT